MLDIKDPPHAYSKTYLKEFHRRWQAWCDNDDNDDHNEDRGDKADENNQDNDATAADYDDDGSRLAQVGSSSSWSMLRPLRSE